MGLIRLRKRRLASQLFVRALGIAASSLRGISLLLFALLGSAALAQHTGHAQHRTSSSTWTATWTASEVPASGEPFDNQTLREIVHTSIGGSAVRIRVANTFGDEPLPIGAAHIALHADGSSIQPGSDHALTFSGQPSFTIPPGAVALSDPIPFAIPANTDLAVSLYLPHAVYAKTTHPLALETTYAAAGDQSASAGFPADAATTTDWPFLFGIDVATPQPRSAIVAFGDSITDGYGSLPQTNHRWPNLLANRLLAADPGNAPAVLDAGIGGNRVLHNSGEAGTSALERFDRDVIDQPGARDVIVLESINDIGAPGGGRPKWEYVSAADLIAGLRQLVERAHEHGLKIYGATLTPFVGAGYASPEKEQERQAVNQWIRTGGAFDGVVDFDQATRDPQHPDRFLAAYDCGDHLHPNNAGYEAMANAIDLALFR